MRSYRVLDTHRVILSKSKTNRTADLNEMKKDVTCFQKRQYMIANRF